MSARIAPPARPGRTPRPPRPTLPVVTTAGLRFHLVENLLEARRGSWLPTNGAGPDEDVNIYLALRLAELANGRLDPRVTPGLDPLAPGPDPRLGRQDRADWYRANGDHRLLMLGLFARGENRRRRDVPWGHTAGTARARDLAVAAACYGAAAALLARGPSGNGAVAAVLQKLADHCEDYVHVVGAMAVRRLGLGARLESADLVRLLPSPKAAAAAAVATLLGSPPDDAADVVLDLALEYGKRRDPGLRTRIERLAPLAGLDASRLLRLEAGQAAG
ncbi:MAG: hypothetical protein IPP62_13650 [bacterium]|jgi:hypothetical protein|nr:hypothetical protein [bacterium]